uniref:Uncharacterized protein n=1 Tax=Panagrolaimus sp. PS1159 TaxID=55785 RepID=A0AC35GPB3_9BILA
MSNETGPINFASPVYPPEGFKPLQVTFPTLTAEEKEQKLLGHDEEFPKIPVEPATLAPKRNLWLQGGVETESGIEFTKALKEELVKAGFIEAENEEQDNAMEG